MKLNALLLVLFAAALAACGGPTASGAPGGRPTISSFAADPATIQPGGSATLSWTVTGADALSVAPEVGAVTGSATTVSPAATTTYTLSASNDAGTTTARTTVTVASTGGGGDGGGGGNGGGGGGGGGTLSAFFLPFDFGGEVSNTTFPDVAVDAAGGVHVAYEIADGGFDEPEPALYGYCPAECTDPSRFSVIPVGGDDDFLSDLNLRLDPQGRPRLSWSVYHGFRYATCDAGCTEPANWTVTPPLGSLVDLTDGSNRMFALDAEGRPRLIYTDDNWDHQGTYFLWCDAGCTDAGNWQEVQLSGEIYGMPSLAIGGDGLPRFAFRASAQGQTRFGYGACDDAHCSSWSGLIAFALHAFYADFALQLDSSDRPRVALYTGPLDEAIDLQPDALYYLWCDAGCTDPNANSWDGADLGVEDQVYNPLDMAFDVAGRPRIAIVTDEGMSLLWCDAQCETAGAGWQRSLLESDDALQQSDPTPPVQDCSYPMWSFGGSNFGYGVSLAFGPQGEPHLAYSADHQWLCPGPNVRTDVRMSRYAQLSP